MNGPFTITNHIGSPRVVDDSGEPMADFDFSCDDDPSDQLRKAEQVCAALNAAFYLAKATGAQSHD